MFLQIFLFELRYRAKRPATYLYFFLFFLIGFLSMATGSTPASEKVFHNAPWVMASANITFSMLMMLVCSAVMGVPLYRDIEHQTRQYLFSYPITKFGYFWGRFIGSFVVVLVIGSAFNWGSIAGTSIGPIMGWVPAERIGSFGLWNYFQPYIYFALGNMLLASTIFFSLVAITRNVKVVYSASILLLIGYLLASFLVTDSEKRDLVKLLDPFMLNTFNLETRYFTPVEKNTLLLPFTKTIAYNRLIWLGISFIITAIAYYKFSFFQFLSADIEKTKKTKSVEEAPADRQIKKLQPDFGNGYTKRIWWQLTKIEFFNIIRDNYFRAILMGGLVFLILDFWIGNTLYGVKDRPITIFLMDYKGYDYIVFIFIILLFYSGETIHREKTTKFNIINDAMPVPNAVFFFSKLTSMLGIAFILASIPIVAGVLIQLLKGYTNFELLIYVEEMYLLTFPSFVQMILLSFAVHLMVNNKFGGHGVGMLIWVVMFILRSYANFDYNLLFYFYTPAYRWSDMNGIGHFIAPQFWFNLYWVCLGALLLTISYLFFERGIAGDFSERWKVAMKRFVGVPRLLIVLFFIGWISAGAFCYYNVSYLNSYSTSTEGKKASVKYEKELKKFENISQPKMTNVVLFADIFPDERKVVIRSLVSIKNKTEHAIDSLHIEMPDQTKYDLLYNGQAIKYRNPLWYNQPIFSFLKKGKDTANYRVYALPTSLKPGDTALLEIHAITQYKGFVNSGFTREILANGTFYSDVLPSFGYNVQRELNSDEDRKKYGLPVKTDEFPVQSDPIGKRTLLFNDDADLIHFEATVSTSKDQIAIAPGYLQKSWETNGRKYFHYIQDTPIDAFATIVSARYDVLRDSVKLSNGKNINIELFHHPTHKYNLDRFLAAYKDGLEFFSSAYGDFQFRQMRLLEFPRYAGFAQSFPNTVPFAESFGWVADFSKPDAFDYVYYVTAHELAHQWWGHQVVPNKTRGSNLISESLAEYTALVLSERKYGRDNMKRFLKDELDGYLTGRARESKKENTFINCNRPYEWYQKGSLILYGLRDLIGDKALNTALHAFRDSFALKENPPFAGSDDLYAFIQKSTPDSFKYYLVDTWEKITLYDNKFLKASAKKLNKDEYEVTLNVSTTKFYADSSGKESIAKMNDYIDVGIFAEETVDKNGRKQTNPLLLQKVKMIAGVKTYQFKVKGKPVKAGIDPYNKLIDRIPDDNTGEVDLD